MTCICLFYFFYDTKEYEHINSLSYFLPTILTLFLVTCGYILFLAFGEKKDKEILFKMIIWFIIGIGSTTLLYEFVKPSYTYAEAKAIVDQRYEEVDVIDSHSTTSTQVETGKEIYRMTAMKDSKKIQLVFNPYTKEIIFLK
ncbi:hypothetical protein [Psychrobacillus psychrotolerans]|uniref:hypothetical protein n=1 Tax=Psychrobacillus psychrotolerans TaxID=126156 RepID=UPI003C715E63